MTLISSPEPEQEELMEVFYLGEYPHRVFAALHLPKRSTGAGLVLCPPFGEEMTYTYGRFARWAKELAEQGLAVLRYHPYGTGDSDGSFADFTLESACAGAAAAVTCLRERSGVRRLGLFGLRFGGSIAVRAAIAGRVDFVLLWSPIVNLRLYFDQLLRLRVTRQLVRPRSEHLRVTAQSMVQELEAGRCVDVLGYEVSPEFYRQMTANSPRWDDAPAPEVLWLGRPEEQGEAMPVVEAWRSHGCQAEAQFPRERPFWQEFPDLKAQSTLPRQFVDASRRWLARQALQEVSAR